MHYVTPSSVLGCWGTEKERKKEETKTLSEKWEGRAFSTGLIDSHNGLFITPYHFPKLKCPPQSDENLPCFIEKY